MRVVVRSLGTSRSAAIEPLHVPVTSQTALSKVELVTLDFPARHFLEGSETIHLREEGTASY